MENQSYNEIYKNLILCSGNDISNAEQIFLLFHAIFVKHNFLTKDKILDSDWNKDYGTGRFEYTFKNNKCSFEITKDESCNKLKIIFKLTGTSNINIDSTINADEDILKNIDFDNLDDSLRDLEKFIKENYINKIDKLIQSHNNVNINSSNNNNFQNIYGGEVDPNQFLRPNLGQGIYNPLPNPYFSTGGGIIPGGNYVGPNSDIFTGHMNPQILPGVHPTIRYDPIGPFGTFGAPNKKKDLKKTDPFMGGNPFGGLDFNDKGPFGGNPFGGSPFG